MHARPPHASPHSGSASPSPSSHEPSRAPSTRRVIAARSAAAPEPSYSQARGTTTSTVAATHRTRPSQSQSQSIPIAANLNSPAHHGSSEPQMGSQQSREDPKPDVRDEPSKPVDVPVPPLNTESSSLSRSYSQSIEPSGPPATQDMSYHLTRPPRLPLPIEEEVHTPGSPIIAPTDVEPAPVLDLETLDGDVLPRRSSALSNTTIDEEDAEELRVDKTKATVPTPFEWKEGGEKVYVTGTIFQWNKKHRLHPV
jgi:hypothetical protein